MMPRCMQLARVRCLRRSNIYSQETRCELVGAERFELSTPSPPDWCANQAAPRSDRRAALQGRPARGADYSWRAVGPQPRQLNAIKLGSRAGRAQPGLHLQQLGQQQFQLDAGSLVE